MAGSPEAELTMLAELAGVEPEEDAGRMPTALSRAAIRSARTSAGRLLGVVEPPSASGVGGAREMGRRSGGEAMLQRIGLISILCKPSLSFLACSLIALTGK